MLTDFPGLHGPYLADLLSQPRAIADTLRSLASVPPHLPLAASKVVLTGMGSSLHGLYPLAIRLNQAGLTAVSIETAELVYAQPKLLESDSRSGRTLLVAVSQSGRSAETVQLLEQISGLGRPPFVIGVTNDANSPLATRADYVVPLAAGPEFSVSCKTYLATLVALDWLGETLTGGDRAAALDELGRAAELVETYLQAIDAHVADLLGRLDGLRHLFLTGRGTSLAAVNTGALILKESTRFHAEGMSSPSFRHGPLEMVGPGLFALVFAGDQATEALNERLVRDIVAAGGRAELVGERAVPDVFRLPPVPPRLRPIMEMLPVQMMSLALAAIAGREPGVFERASKITATE